MLREEEPRSGKSTYSLPRRAFLSAIVTIGTMACGVIPDRWSEYHYYQLQGTIGGNTPRTAPDAAEDQFFTTREDFLRHSAVSRPVSILFSGEDGEWKLQIAAPGNGWVPGAFAVIKRDSSDKVDICVAESEETAGAYQALFEDFERRKIAPLGSIRTFTSGQQQPCDSFLR